MATDEDAIVKRIIKAYLTFKGEASTKMIVEHINTVGYGLRKPVSGNSLPQKMRLWSQNGKSNTWFRVEYEVRNRQKWWRLV